MISSAESGDGGKCKQGDSCRKSRQGSGNPAEQDGRPIANLSVATSETVARQGGTGERKENRFAPRVFQRRGSAESPY